MVEPELPAATVGALEQKGNKTKQIPHIATVNLLVRTDARPHRGRRRAAQPQRSPPVIDV